MNIAKNMFLVFENQLLPKQKLVHLLKMKCMSKQFLKRKLQRLWWKEPMIILQYLVSFCYIVFIIGVPLSESSGMRTEPNKSAIDLAVKALKEKERQQKPATSSIVPYKPKEDHKSKHDVHLPLSSYV